MTTFAADWSEQVTISPDAGTAPWTIQLPDPEELPANNGRWVDVKAIDFGRRPVTIACLGTASIEEANLGPKAASVTRVFLGDAARFTYNSERNTFNIYQTATAPDHVALLYGPPSAISSNNATLTDWAGSGATEFFKTVPEPNETTGVIVIPKTGLYRTDVHVICTQSNSNKEFQIVLRLDRSLSANLDISTFQVATDKTPRYRSFSFSAYVAGQQDEEWSLSMRAEGASFGTLSFEPACSFAVEQSFLS